MKISIDPKDLAEAVAWAARYIPQRPAVPILSGLLLEAGDGKLTLSVFDYDVAARCEVDAEVAEPGRVVLSGRILAELAKSLPGESWAELASTETEVSLTCGRVSYNLLTMPIADYPALPEPPAACGTINGDDFATAVSQVVTACSRDNTLPMLTAVRLDAAADLLTFAATDRYRIHVRDLSWSPAKVDLPGVMIPSKVLADVVKTLRGSVSLGWDASAISISAEGRTVIARLLDPQFIDYRAWTTSGGPVAATINTVMFVTAIKRVSLLADRYAAVKCRFSADEVYLTASSEEGKGAETVPAVLNADEFDIAFQPGFLLDALAGVQTTEVVLQMESSTQPALISGRDDDSYKARTMSLRVA